MKQTKYFYLHIGAGKTGTTALQIHFVKNRNALKDVGIYYPEHNNDFKAKQFKIIVGNAPVIAGIIKNENCDSKEIKKIVNEYIKKSEGKDILLSSEIMSFFKENCLEELKKAINNHGYELKIIYYVRAIADHMMSSYHQNLKRSLYKKSFNDFIHERRNRFAPTIKKLCSILEEKNIIIKNYDAVNENIFKDFIKTIFQINELNKFKFIDKKINRSLNGKEQEIMRFLNLSTENNKLMERISNELIEKNPNSFYEMSMGEEEFNYISYVYKNDLEYINRFLLLRSDKEISIAKNIKVKKTVKENDLTEFEKALLSVVSVLAKYNVREK